MYISLLYITSVVDQCREMEARLGNYSVNMRVWAWASYLGALVLRGRYAAVTYVRRV